MRKLILFLLLVSILACGQTATQYGRSNFNSSVQLKNQTISFSATPAFDATLGNVITITLTGNVTSSTLTGLVAGQPMWFVICQDATGGRTFIWPTNVKGASAPDVTPSTCSAQTFVSDGTNAYISGGAASSSVPGYQTVTTNIQSAITAACAASPAKGVFIPTTYQGTDSFTNSCNTPVVDNRGIAPFRGVQISVRDFGATGNSGFYPGSGMVSGTQSVSINPVFKKGNMSPGTRIVIQGAGVAGADLDTTITNVSGGIITVAATASTTVSGVGVWWGNDDTAAIQAAITYAHNQGGGTIVFPTTGGDYIVSNVTIPAIDTSVSLKWGGISLECEGRRQTTAIVGIGADQTDIITIAAGAHPTKIKGCDFVGFSWNSSFPENYRFFNTGDITTAYVSVPDNAVMDSTSVTVGMDFNSASAPAVNTWIVAKDSTINPPSYGFKTNASGNLICSSTDNFNNQIASPASGAGVWDGNWHRAVCTVDTATTIKIHLFIDGAEVGTGTSYPNPIGYSGASILSMGGSTSNPGAIIKLARVWTKNSALSVATATTNSVFSTTPSDPPASVFFRFNATSPEIDAVAALTGTVIGTTTGSVSSGPSTLRHVIAIDIQGGIEHEIVDNFFDSGLYHGILATSTFNNLFHFNRFYGPWDSCIKFVSGASAVIDTRVYNNEAGVCGASHLHGWFLEQLSAGGGGSNWLQIRGNDCEGTEWNGCYYMKNTSSYIIEGNRSEVDSAIGNGTFAVLWNAGGTGVARDNDFSGGITMDGGGVQLFNNNLFVNGSGCAITYTANGGTVDVIGPGAVSNMSRSGLCGTGPQVATAVFQNHIEGFYNGPSMHIFIGNAAGAEPSNVRKMGFMSLAPPLQGSEIGWGNTSQGTTNTAGQRLPLVPANTTFQNGDRLYNSYWPNNGAENFGWVCTSATCSTVDGTTWTGTWYYLNADQFMRQWATSVPVSGQHSPGDQVYNANFDGQSSTVYKWLCTVGGNPGTWKTIFILDPTAPGALGGTTPASGAFTTLSATGNLTVGGTTTLNSDTTVNSQLNALPPNPGKAGLFIKAGSITTPDLVTCGGACSLKFWVKADSLGLSNGASVTTWNDSSVGAHAVTMGASKPTFQTNVIGSQPVVRWSGTNNLGTTASYTLSSTGTMSVMMVQRHNIGVSATCTLFSGNGGNFAYPYTTVSNFRLQSDSGSAGFATLGPSNIPSGDDGLPHIITGLINTGTSIAYVDGVQVVTSAGVTSVQPWTNGVTLNGVGSCNADTAEIIIYDGTLDTASRQAVEAYLGLKYGIASASQKLVDIRNSSNTQIGSVDLNGRFTATSLSTPPTTVAFSATPIFDAQATNSFKITLTGNVTSSTFVNAAAGQYVNFLICQDATGSRTFVWPTNVKGAMTIGGTLSTCSAQVFYYDGTNAYATSPGVTNQ
jgi:hypothetical protein